MPSAGRTTLRGDFPIGYLLLMRRSHSNEAFDVHSLFFVRSDSSLISRRKWNSGLFNIESTIYHICNGSVKGEEQVEQPFGLVASIQFCDFANKLNLSPALVFKGEFPEGSLVKDDEGRSRMVTIEKAGQVGLHTQWLANVREG